MYINDYKCDEEVVTNISKWTKTRLYQIDSRHSMTNSAGQVDHLLTHSLQRSYDQRF